MAIEQLGAYTLIEKKTINDINSEGYLLRHNKTGAKVVLLSNDDDNKVFYIGFRTPPKDSTGVPHIIEHTVLCGSEKFPVKDPFIELAKGSLNTFLNAMTYPDKTVYPVASCNDKDFQNLMDVYLDAVFHPNIYKEEKIFKQEGWHYEMEDAGSELTINGVVYNEMKGAFSSPDDVLNREIVSSLYPHTTYAVESGGDPEVIPELTYEDFLAFHQKFYHPSNSYIYLYGNMNMEEKLKYIDEEYLSDYDAITVDSELFSEPAFQETVTVCKEYPIMESESEDNNTYLSYNICVGENMKKADWYGIGLLADLLCMMPGAPIKQALLDAGIGTDVSCFYDTGIKQPYFTIIVKNANEDQKDEFVKIIEENMKSLAANGLDKTSLQASLNRDEFRFREADFGSYPKGLMYGLNILESWLYNENQPFMPIELLDIFAELKAGIAKGCFEELLQKYLIDNTHKSVVVVKPVRGLGVKKDKELADRLAAVKASLSKEEIDDIVSQTAALKKYQEEPSSIEDLKKIPLLRREDLKKEAVNYVNEVKKVGDTTFLYHNIFTNGIGYLRVMFDLKQVPEELFPYIGILKLLIGLVDTKKHTYSELYNAINLKTGGIVPSINTFLWADDLDQYTMTFDMKAKALYDHIPDAFALITEMLVQSEYVDEKRISELIAEARSEKQAQMMAAGHSLTVSRAMSYLSETAALHERMNGLDFYRLLEKLESDFDIEKKELLEKINKLTHYIFRPENLMIDYTAQKEGLVSIEEQIDKLKACLFTDPLDRKPFTPEVAKKNEGFMSSSQVQYVCRAGNFVKKGLPYTGALKVLKVMMGYDYLWTNVRVKGGAYGCMCNFGKSGESFFVSYRDPNLEKTIEVYEKAADYIAGFEADERTMTQYVIGAISDMDIPMTPATKGAYSLSGYMTHCSYEEIQKERDELLGTDVEAIRKLSDYLRAFMSYECLCVVGNEEKVKEQEALFMKTEYLFH